MIVTVVLPDGQLVQLDAADDMSVWTLHWATRKLGERICEALVDAGYFAGGIRP